MRPLPAVSRHDGRKLAATAPRSSRRSDALRRGADRSRGSSTAWPTPPCRDLVRLQEQAGVDIVTDGELRRDNFYSFVAGKLERRPPADAGRDARPRRGQGRRSSACSRRSTCPRTPSASPCCVGRLGAREPLAVEELRFVRRQTDRADQGDAARPVPADARDVRARGDAARVRDQGGTGRGRRAAAAGRSGGAGIRRAPTSSSSTSRC